MNDQLRQPEDAEPQPQPAPPPEPLAEGEVKSPGLELPRLRKATPGGAAGIDYHELSRLPSAPASSYITCLDYAAIGYRP